MNVSKFIVQVIKVTLFFLFLAGCTTSSAVPSAALTLASTAVLPTTTPTLVPTPTLSVLIPGDKIGQMSIALSQGFVPSWLDYCSPVFSAKAGGEAVDCNMPLISEFEIGAPWSAKDKALLDSSWKGLTWELYIDDHAVDLNEFGTSDAYMQTGDGTFINSRIWNLKLVNATEGKHTLRYLIHVNQEVNDGFSVTKPGILESVVNLTLAAPSAFSTVTPVRTPPTTKASWWNYTVFYEVFVRSFADSTTGPLANDGIGDLQGLIEKLDYLNDGNPATTDDLGVTGLWLMPIMQSPSYHGYDVFDYYIINKDYGTNEDFKRLLSEAHKRGIKIIIDLILNHTSSEHPWFIEARDNPESEQRDWYIWSVNNPGYLGPWGETVWHYSPTGYYYGIFSSGMPDLNLKNPQVTSEMENVARFWLEDIGVDGFRLDGARHLIEEGPIQVDTEATHEWWKTFRTIYKASNPEAMTVGEIWSRGSDVVKYVQGDELDLAFDFDLASALVSGVQFRDANRIQKALTSSYDLYGSMLSATFLTNHDMTRVMSQLGMDTNKAKLAASVLLTAPGVPFVYYGEEIGMTGVKPDEFIRSPMQWAVQENAGFSAGVPWESVNEDYKAKNVAEQSKDPTSLLTCYRELIRLRGDHIVLQLGDYLPVDSKDNAVLAYLRSDSENNVLVIINLGEQSTSDYDLSLIEGSLVGTYQAQLLYGKDAVLQNLTSNENGGFDSYQPMPEVPGAGVLIIQLNPIQ
jgi:alpha-amylase